MKGVRSLLKSRGLNLSKKEAATFWDEVISVAPWMNSSDPYDAEVWARVAYLARKKEVQEGKPLSLPFLPIIAAIRQCVNPSKTEADPKLQNEKGSEDHLMTDLSF